jgi:capsule polysaccharide modification protein KpsS
MTVSDWFEYTEGQNTPIAVFIHEVNEGVIEYHLDTSRTRHSYGVKTASYYCDLGIIAPLLMTFAGMVRRPFRPNERERLEEAGMVFYGER